MATKEQIAKHIDKSKEKLAEAKKNAGENKYDLAVRKQKKKTKRLTRKVAKISNDEKNAVIRKTKKKDRKAKD